MAQSQSTIEIPALGRPFQLGMLYDCRKDSLIPGITLWDLDSLQKDLCIKPQPKTEFEVIASDSIDDKASALNVSASLKASFLGGLVEVGGSAKYLNDTKKSKQQARVTLQYRMTTKYEQLTMSHLGTQNISYPAVFEHGTATHVVTAILYGAQAFFVFDRAVSSSESVQEIEGSLQVVIGKIVSIKGEADIQMNEKEKSHAENFSCKFYGDFSLENNPSSFQDAMRVYATLPKMMGTDGEKAVPVRVWLYPLTMLDSKAAKMVREISTALIFDAQKVLEQLNDINMRCNDLEKDPITDTFPEIKGKIRGFKDLCKQHRQTFQKQLATILPSIRGGGKEERALVDLLMSVNQSPFNSKRLDEFLDSKKREVNLVKSYLSILSGEEIETVSSQSRLEEIVLDPQNEFVISFTFTSLHDEEPFLSTLQDCLQRQFFQAVDDSSRGGHVLEKWKAWFEDKEKNRNARKAAKSIIDFACVNKSSGKTRCVVASVSHGDTPGASVYLYEDGELISSSFELPSKPLPLLISDVGHDSVQLTFQPADYGRAAISSYQVEYRRAGKENWQSVCTEDSQGAFLLRGLHPNMEYQFRYVARSKPGLSETSDVSQTVRTLPTSPPGKPEAVTVESSKISVTWKSPRAIGAGAVLKEYKVEYREGSIDEWEETKTSKKTEFWEIAPLRPQTAYKVRVSAVCADGAQSAPSDETEISTSLEEEEGKSPVAQRYLQESTLVVPGQPSIYVLPLKKASSDGSSSCITYLLGKENLRVPNKVIMVMGATGSGKTTLINGMVNYILGVQWRDPFRFKLIHEVTNRSQAESQTSEVTAYVVNHQKGFRVPYSLTIIDTPGFGDTRGIEHDKQITRQIREFFSTPGGTDHIDAICIVVQASFARLTHAQKYVFDSVLSIFGKDIKDNIQVLVTFADGQTPPVLEAIRVADVPCAKDADGTPVHFKFNNSALFAKNPLDNKGHWSFDEMFWEMGCQSMKTFFDSANRLETKSLTLTKEVLRERKELEVAVEGLQPQIKAGLTKLEELRKTKHALDQHKEDMAANRDFEYEVEITVPVQIDISGSGNYITNCQICHFTCHFPCGIPNDDGKRGCAAIDQSTGMCTVCPSRCVWNVHFNQKYRFEYQKKKEKQTYQELKRKYEEASGEVMSTEKVLESLTLEYEEVKCVLVELIKKSSQSLQRLQEIALKPNPLSTPEYIDLLILSEEEERKSGFQERIRTLTEVKKVAEIIQKIANKEPLLPGEQDLYEHIEQKKNPSTLKDTFLKGVASVRSWFK
uniref:Fibronectin type-III domain-containing protein n=1 Tax=Pogona vitticeps TaxID=103695 RepID=A0A6J0U538_9SAUR